MSSEELRCNSEVWPAKVKNYLFNKARAGTIDLHYRDYEEPPGNGGVFFKGGRPFFDMGPIEKSAPGSFDFYHLLALEKAGDPFFGGIPPPPQTRQRGPFLQKKRR